MHSTKVIGTKQPTSSGNFRYLATWYTWECSCGAKQEFRFKKSAHEGAKRHKESNQ